MTVEELRLRQLAGQHLLAPADPGTVLRDLCGVQAQFLSNALHAVRIRAGAFGEADAAGLVKSWTLRGTVHVFAAEDLPLFLHRDRPRILRLCDTLEGDGHITKERKRYFASLITEAVAAGTVTREALKEACMGAGMTEEESESVFDPWGGTIRALCEQGVICHAVQEKKAFRSCPPFEPMEREGACLELTRRYFTHYGPAKLRDAAYFFGAPQAEVRKYLDKLPVKTTQWDGQTYYYLGGDGDLNGPLPGCLFLAGFDPLMLGYEKRESLYLPPEHLRKVFSLAGIVSPALLLRGRVAGKWKRTGRKVDVTAFESLSAADRRAVEESARALWPDCAAVRFLE